MAEALPDNRLPVPETSKKVDPRLVRVFRHNLLPVADEVQPFSIMVPQKENS
jgi:hypothetical protein